MLHKIRRGSTPKTLIKALDGYKIEKNSETRHGRKIGYTIPAYRTNAMANSFFVSTIKSWNKIPIEIRDTVETNNFKSKLNRLYQS